MSWFGQNGMQYLLRLMMLHLLVHFTVILLPAVLYSFFADGFLVQLTMQETKEEIDKMSNAPSGNTRHKLFLH